MNSSVFDKVLGDLATIMATRPFSAVHGAAQEVLNGPAANFAGQMADQWYRQDIIAIRLKEVIMPAFTPRVPVALFSLSLLAFVPVTGFAQEAEAPVEAAEPETTIPLDAPVVAPEEPVAEATVEGSATATVEATVTEAPIIEENPDDPVAAEAPPEEQAPNQTPEQAVATPEVPAVDEATTAEAPAEESPVAEDPAPEAEPEAEPAVAEAEPPSVILFDHLVSAQLLPETVVAAQTAEAPFNRVMLAHPDATDLPHTMLIAGDTAPDGAAVGQGIIDQLASLDSVQAGDFQGTPVWIIDGESRFGPDGARAAALTGPRARLIVTQSCPPADGPVMLGVITTATRGVPVIMDAILNTLTLSMPDDAAACPADIGEALTALPLGPIELPPESVAEAPLAMQSHTAFGLSFAVPESLVVTRERDTDRRREYTLSDVDEATGIGSEVILRVFTEAQRRDATEASIDTPEFTAFLSRVSEMTVTMTDQTTQVGSLTYHHFTGHGSVDVDGQLLPAQILYLITDRPSASGLNPWIGIASTGLAEDQVQALRAGILDSLTVSDPAFYDGAQQMAFIDGAITLALQPSDIILEQDVDPDGGLVIVASDAMPETAHVLYAFESRRADGTELIGSLRRRFEVINAVTEAQIDGIPAWVIEGRVDRTPGAVQLRDGSTSPGVMVVTRQCLPGAGPIVVGVLTTDERLGVDSAATTVMAPVRLTMPAGSVPCSVEVDALMPSLVTQAQSGPPPAVSMPPQTPPVEDDKPDTTIAPQDPSQPPVEQPLAPTPEAPTPEAPMAQAPVAPNAEDGKPDDSAPVPNPDDLAWERALAAGTQADVMAYLQGFPNGVHRAEAEEWLRANQPAPAPQLVQPDLDPQEQAWQQALADGSATAMWNYLKAFPMGPHADDARAILEGRALPPAPAPVPEPELSKRG